MRLAPYPVGFQTVTAPCYESPLLLAFLGQRAVGKSSIANWCRDSYGGSVVSFGDAVKVECFDVLACSTAGNVALTARGGQGTITFQSLPTPDAGSYTDAEKIAWVNERKAELTEFVQDYGSEYRRGQDPSYWTDQLLAKIERLRSQGVNAIYVDDVRFRDEAAALSDIGFTLIRVSCDHQEQIRRATERDSSFDPAVLQHISETDALYAPVHHAINNSGPLHEATSAVRDIVLSVLNPS